MQPFVQYWLQFVGFHLLYRQMHLHVLCSSGPHYLISHKKQKDSVFVPVRESQYQDVLGQ